MDKTTQQRLIEYLQTYVTDNKNKKMQEVLAHRTRHVSLIMEDIYQAHNANAVIRSSECFGVQDMHIVEDQFKFSVSSTVAMGATKWMSLYKYKSVEACFKAVRKNGYRIVATTPHAKAHSLYDLPLDKPLALVFGTENVGLTKYALEHADEYVAIPMVGFTQSFNVSVSVALCLQHITRALQQSKISWHLNEDEKLEVLLEWLSASIRGSDVIIKEFLNK